MADASSNRPPKARRQSRHVDPEQRLHGVKEVERAFHVTGRPSAHGNLDAARRVQAKLVVEGGYTKDLRGGKAKVSRDPVNAFP